MRARTALMGFIALSFQAKSRVQAQSETGELRHTCWCQCLAKVIWFRHVLQVVSGVVSMLEYARYPSLKDRVVFITGGAGGIGRVLVRAFAEQGAKIGFVDIDAQASAAIVESFSDCDVVYDICDLRDIADLKRGFSVLTDRLGAPNVLINNAANDDRHNWQDVTSDYFDERMQTNLRHMYFSIQDLAPMMAERGGGSIVNMGSYSWIEGVTDLSIYTMAKAAIHGMTRSFARSLGKDKIRVNTIVPGWIMTDRQKELWLTEEKLRETLERQSLPQPIDPIYVANMALFLASDDSAMCSAGDFHVTGGLV